MLIWFICVIALVFIDQLSKWIAVISLEGKTSFYLIRGFLRFSYVENRGAAFGMLENNRWIFLVLSTLTIVCLIAFMVVSKPKSKLERVGLALILAGGIGNMIDRVILGYVIDFIDFYTIWNYVFNIADSCICIGVAVIIIYVIKLSVEEYRFSRRVAREIEAGRRAAETSERTACRAPGDTIESDNGNNNGDTKETPDSKE